jgi:hypothetical protein
MRGEGTALVAPSSLLLTTSHNPCPDDGDHVWISRIFAFLWKQGIISRKRPSMTGFPGTWQRKPVCYTSSISETWSNSPKNNS